MLKFSRKVEYALIALVHMSNREAGELTTTRELAEKFHLPLELIGKIMQSLARKNLIASVQGARGGYFLAREEDSIRLSEIMTAIDGPRKLVDCENSRGGCCEREPFCNIRDSMQHIQQNILNYFDSMSLKNFKEQLSPDIFASQQAGRSKMAAIPSKMIPLGATAPDFSLPDVVSGQTKSLAALKSKKATLVMFICNHCPYVKHVQGELVRLANDYQRRGVSVIAISANDAEAYPEDSPEKMKKIALEWQYPFPYLYDESQAVALAYSATCTPDFFLFDNTLRLVYRGQLDDSRPGNPAPVTGQDLRAALDAVLTDKPVDSNQKPSIGCSIKWLP